MSWRGTIRLAAAIYLPPVGAIFLTGLCSTFNSDADVAAAFLMLGLFPVWFLATVMLFIYTLGKRYWARSASILIAASLVWPSFRPAAQLPDYVHLAVMWPTYMNQVDVGHQTRFDWGMGGMVTSEFRRTLVYDRTDGLTEESFEPRTFNPSEGITVKHLIGHFYLVTENW